MSKRNLVDAARGVLHSRQNPEPAPADVLAYLSRQGVHFKDYTPEEQSELAAEMGLVGDDVEEFLEDFASWNQTT